MNHLSPIDNDQTNTLVLRLFTLLFTLYKCCSQTSCFIGLLECRKRDLNSHGIATTRT